MKRKNYELAYQDKLNGMTYAEIAKKHKVTINAVRQWQQRHWRIYGVQDALDTQQCMDDAQRLPLNLTELKPSKILAPVISKQVADTNAALIYVEYNRDTLPQLEPRQDRFVEEYLVDLSKTDAAIRAGYSANSAPDIGCHLYSNPAIYAHIQVALAERRKRTGVNVDNTLREMARVAYANPARVVAKDGSLIEGASEDDLAAIASIKVKVTPMKDGSEMVEREVKFHDKNKALEMLGKHQGMFIDRTQIMVAHGTFDTAGMSEKELRTELERQLLISNTIDITPKNCTPSKDIK
jgi:phage terminase small subunit